MYAIIETGGKQYRVSEGDVIEVERCQAQAGETVTLDRVLLLADGTDIQIGTPYIEGARVLGEVIENGKGKKIVVFKYKAKKNYHKKQGHRQPYTKIKIASLTGEPQKNPKSDSAPVEMAPEAEKKTSSEPKKEKTISLSMKKDELIRLAEEKGIKVESKDTKADILAKIEAGSASVQ